MTKDIVLSNGKTVSMTGLKPRKSVTEVLKSNSIKGTERVEKVLLILLDASGSMLDTMETDKKIDISWRVLQNELMPNMSGWNYGVLVFQGYEESYWEIYPCDNTQALVLATIPEGGGSTPMRHVLTKAWDWVRTHAKQARFILMSDGCPTDGSSNEILSFVRENSSIPIDTVGIGAGSIYGGYDPIFLNEISTITGGIFVEASTVRKLSTTILELAPANRPLLGTVKELP